MANPHYAPNTANGQILYRAELDLIEDGFDTVETALQNRAVLDDDNTFTQSASDNIQAINADSGYDSILQFNEATVKRATLAWDGGGNEIDLSFYKSDGTTLGNKLSLLEAYSAIGRQTAGTHTVYLTTGSDADITLQFYANSVPTGKLEYDQSDAAIELSYPSGPTLGMNATGMKLGTGATVSTILDEDTMASDSATALATQQSIKAYVDAGLAGGTADAGTLDGLDSLQFLRSDVADTVAGQLTFTNSALLANTIAIYGKDTGAVARSLITVGGTNIATFGDSAIATKVTGSSITIGAGTAVTTVLDEDTMVSDSATALATQQSIKAYVDAGLAGGTADADTLDTLDSLQFLRADVDDEVWGQLTIATGATLNNTIFIGAKNAGGTAFDVVGVTVGNAFTVGSDSLTTDIRGSAITIGGGTAVTTVLDEDTMVSDSATALATQQSIKAYVDAGLAGGTADADTLDTLDSLQFLRSDVADTVSGQLTFANSALLGNTIAIYGKDTGATARQLIAVDGTNIATFGSTAIASKLIGSTLAADVGSNAWLSVSAAGLTLINDFTHTANEAHEINLFGDGTVAQAGAYRSKLRIWGGSAEDDCLELFQAVGGGAIIKSNSGGADKDLELRSSRYIVSRQLHQFEDDVEISRTTGLSPELRFLENDIKRAEVRWDGGGDELQLQAYAADGTTLNSQLSMLEAYTAIGRQTAGTYIHYLTTGSDADITLQFYASSTPKGSIKYDQSESSIALQYPAGPVLSLTASDVDIDGSSILVASDIGTTVQAYDADTLKSDTTATLTAGFSATPYNAGTKSTGTFTPDEANGNFQYAINGGAHTLAPPTNNCTIIVQYTNNASAGAITTSGFTMVGGDTLTTTNGDDFLMFITKCNGFSHLNVVALQ